MPNESNSKHLSSLAHSNLYHFLYISSLERQNSTYRIHIEQELNAFTDLLLTLESERGTDLVARFLEVLSIEGGTETKGDTCSELDVVC